MRPHRIGRVADLGVLPKLYLLDIERHVAAHDGLLVLLVQRVVLPRAKTRHVATVHPPRERRDELAQQLHVLVVEADAVLAGYALTAVFQVGVFHVERRSVGDGSGWVGDVTGCGKGGWLRCWVGGGLVTGAQEGWEATAAG